MRAVATVLIVQEDRETAESTGSHLERRGFEVDYALDGIEGLRLASESRYDAVIIDGNLPRLAGLEVVRKLREHAHSCMPILMVSRRHALEDRIEGLQSGLDDFLPKPFAVQELEARLRAIIRRYRKEVASQILRVADLSLDPLSNVIWRGDRTSELSPVGAKLLQILMRQSPRLVTRKEVERELWGDDLPHSDALRSHIYNLRKVIDRGFPCPLLHTVQALGYRIAQVDLSDPIPPHTHTQHPPGFTAAPTGGFGE